MTSQQLTMARAHLERAQALNVTHRQLWSRALLAAEEARFERAERAMAAAIDARLRTGKVPVRK